MTCGLPDPPYPRRASLETQGLRHYSTQRTYENLLLLRPVKLNKKENVMQLDKTATEYRLAHAQTLPILGNKYGNKNITSIQFKHTINKLHK